MHPGPMNRGIEIASDVADGARSLILDQVANGLAVRMAVLYLLGGGAGVSSVPALPPKAEAEPTPETTSEVKPGPPSAVATAARNEGSN